MPDTYTKKPRGFHNRLTDAEVEQIRPLLQTHNQSEIAKMIGRSPAAVNHVVKRIRKEVSQGLFDVEKYALTYPF